MLSALMQRAHYLKLLVNENSPTILTAVGVTGTVATAYLTGRATFKAAEIIANKTPEYVLDSDGVFVYKTENDEREGWKPAIDKVSLSKTQKVKLVWKVYIPPVGVCVVTVGSIVMANKISSKRIAALTIAGGITERAFQEYKDKVVEKLGANKDQAVRDEIAQNRVDQNPPRSNEIVMTGSGKVLCYDMVTGRYFNSSMEDIKRAEIHVNQEVLNHNEASLSQFYEELGIPPTTYGDSVGWNLDNLMEVVFSTTMAPDNTPCIAIDFRKLPIPEYNRVRHG